MASRFFVFVLLAATAAIAQDAPTATVYVYRKHNYLLKDTRHPPLICDGIQVSVIPDGSYVVMTFKPGRHVLTQSIASSKIMTVDLGAGEKRYFRSDLCDLKQVSAEQGAREVEGLKSAPLMVPSTSFR